MGAALSARAVECTRVVGVDPQPSARETCSFDTASSLHELNDALPAPWVVVLCLPTTEAYLSSIKEVVDLPQPEKLAAVVNLSTVGLDAAAQGEALLAQQMPEVDYVESLITGGVLRAATGDITMLVGSRNPLSHRVKALLEAMSPRLHTFASVHQARIAKLVNNLAMLGIASVTVEALDLGVRSGLTIETVFRVLREGTGSSYILNNSLTRALLEGDFTTGFATHLALKDIGLALDVAREVSCRTPHGDVVRGELEQAISAGQSDATFARIATARGL
jgi:3-hydroxyisobutyrate dehydrogenase-like beta-hydroxyacid dehydrogenase